MRSTHLLVFVLACGLANAQFSGMISGLVEGLVEGGIKGVVGAWAPIVRDGMTMMYNLVQTEIRVGMGLIEQLMKAAPTLMNTITNTISGIFSQGTNMVKGFTGMGKLSMQNLAVTTQHGITGTFATFGQLKPTHQKAIADTLGNANRVLVSVTKLQMNSIKNADKEVPAIHKIMETDHKNAKVLFAVLKSKAPKLTGFAQTLYEKTAAEFNASKKKMDKPAQQGLTMMQDSIRLSQKGIEKILGSMNAGAKKEFGPMLHLMNNLVHITNAAF